MQSRSTALVLPFLWAPRRSNRMIHPITNERRHPQLVYEIVVSEILPCFDVGTTVKQLFLNERQTQRFNSFAQTVKPVSTPCYVIGHVLRNVVIFAPPDAGKILAVISSLLQSLTIAIVVFSFQVGFVKVLVRTFEFWLLAATATIWTCCSFFYVQDIRAIALAVAWLDFVDLVLIETYLNATKRVVLLAAVASGVYLTLVTVGVSLNVVHDSRYPQALVASPVHSLTIKDVLVNTMGTMVMIMGRVAYRTYNILQNEKHAPSSWVRSIGYRCRIALRARNAESPTARTFLGPMDSSMLQSERARTEKSLHMRLIHFPACYNPIDTVVPNIDSFGVLPRWQLCSLYACGVIGYTLSSATFRPVTSSNESTTGVTAIVGLGSTFAFWLWFSCCSQRALLFTLCTSFDFVFLYVQLLAAYICACDLFYWNWAKCCGVVADFLWMHWVLTLDAITPAMKARLALKAWYAVPVLVLSLLKALVLMTRMFFRSGGWTLQNRLLLDHEFGGYEVKVFVFPFLFSRQITIFIWCIRLLYRIGTRKSENDLVMMLGNVEYDYEQRRQVQSQNQKSVSVVPTATLPRK